MGEEEKQIDAAVTFDPALVARVIRKKEEPVPLEVAVHDSVSLADQVILRSPGESTDGVRVGNDRMSSGDDLYADSTVKFSMHGSPAQGEQLSISACNILRQYFNRGSEVWEEATKPKGREAGVDGELRHSASGAVLKIQVIRAEASQELRRKVAQQGMAEGTMASDALADTLQLTVERKRRQAYPDIVLALDATETARFAFAPVVASFRKRHGAWATQVGFKEIWVVGPIPDLVERLDVIV